MRVVPSAVLFDEAMCGREEVCAFVHSGSPPIPVSYDDRDHLVRVGRNETANLERDLIYSHSRRGFYTNSWSFRQEGSQEVSYHKFCMTSGSSLIPEWRFSVPYHVMFVSNSGIYRSPKFKLFRC